MGKSRDHATPIDVDPAPGAIVTQQMLRDLAAKRKASNALNRETRELRDHLVAMHDAKAAVEPGPLSFDVVEATQLDITSEAIRKAFGIDELMRIRAAILPRPIRRLELIDRTALEIATARDRERVARLLDARDR